MFSVDPKFSGRIAKEVGSFCRATFQRKVLILTSLLIFYLLHGTIVSILSSLVFVGIILAILFYVVVSPRRSTLITGLAFVTSIISQSPVIPAITSVNGNIFYLVFSAIALTLLVKRLKHRVFVWTFVLFILFLQLLATVYWSEPKLIVLPFYFLTGLLIACSLKDDELRQYVSWATKFVFILLVGGFIGLFYTFILNGQAIFSFNNEDTRSNGLYLTTFSNWYVRGVIRPAGIYDEPGALSLVVCLVAAIRDKIGATKRTTTLILVMGLITLSVAHVIFLMLYLFNVTRKSIALAALKFGIVSLVLFVGIYNSPFRDVFDEFLFSRFEVVDGRLAGDNRTALIENSINFLKDYKVVAFGLDSDCIAKPEACRQKGYAQAGDNPLGPLVLGGITQFFPFYAVVLSLLAISIIKKTPIVFGVALILLSRNEIMSYSYSLLIMIYYILVFNLNYDRSLRSINNSIILKIT